MVTLVGRLESEVSRLTGVFKPGGGKGGARWQVIHLPNDKLSGRDRTCQRTQYIRHTAREIGETDRMELISLHKTSPFGVLDHFLRN
jgi:hypothetical protein